MEPKPHPDWQLISELGGPIKVAAKLGWNKAGSVQRVQNWKHRGIPAAVKLEHPEMFLKGTHWNGQERRKTKRAPLAASN